jgi:hypothetical protein
MFEVTIPQSVKMLQNLKKILDKAQVYADAKKFDVSVLLNSRLAPDQFNLIRQLQIACDTAKLGASRLSGKEAPSHDDSEKTLAEVQARIDQTISYLQNFKPNEFTGSEEKRISQPRWEGKSLSGQEYVLQHWLPNLYFHITTAYSILRANGVDCGKKDYLGEMPYKS